MGGPRIIVPYTAVLTYHPGTYSRAVHGIDVHVCWTADEPLALSYVLKGDFTRLRSPPPRPARRADCLWQHTCFEAFVAMKGKPEYYEFNFAPSGEWAAYAFHGYRDGAPLAKEELTPGITVRSAAHSLELDAMIRLDRLPAIERGAPLRLALSAVVEEEHGILSYWALKHPPDKPDFHHSDAFALELEAPVVEAVQESAVCKR